MGPELSREGKLKISILDCRIQEKYQSWMKKGIGLWIRLPEKPFVEWASPYPVIDESPLLVGLRFPNEQGKPCLTDEISCTPQGCQLFPLWDQPVVSPISKTTKKTNVNVSSKGMASYGNQQLLHNPCQGLECQRPMWVGHFEGEPLPFHCLVSPEPVAWVSKSWTLLKNEMASMCPSLILGIMPFSVRWATYQRTNTFDTGLPRSILPVEKEKRVQPLRDKSESQKGQLNEILPALWYFPTILKLLGKWVKEVIGLWFQAVTPLPQRFDKTSIVLLLTCAIW